MDTQVRKDEARSRYELLLDGEVVGVADYRDDGDALVFPHTEIDARPPGQGPRRDPGPGGHGRRAGPGREVVPSCWFVRGFLDANPGYAALRAG